MSSEYYKWYVFSQQIEKILSNFPEKLQLTSPKITTVQYSSEKQLVSSKIKRLDRILHE